jgi:Fe-S-cluster containining protein
MVAPEILVLLVLVQIQALELGSLAQLVEQPTFNRLVAGSIPAGGIMNFPCTSCGSCCRRVFMVDIFPREWIKEDGSCIHLENNLCKIYNTRPDYCRIGYSFKNSGMSELEYQLQTAKICNYFMEQDGITDKLIPLTLFQTEQNGN